MCLKVREFALAVEVEDEIAAIYGGAVKAPKVLADIVESVIAAVYVDCDFDLKFLWQVSMLNMFLRLMAMLTCLTSELSL